MTSWVMTAGNSELTWQLNHLACIFPHSTIFLVAVVVFDLDCSFWDCCSLQSSYKFLSKDKFFEIGLYKDSIFQIFGLMRVTNCENKLKIVSIILFAAM